MSARTYDPARVYVRVIGFTEGLEWGFWLAASVWWIVILDLSPIQLVAMGAVLEVSVLISETPTGVVAAEGVGKPAKIAATAGFEDRSISRKSIETGWAAESDG